MNNAGYNAGYKATTTMDCLEHAAMSNSMYWSSVACCSFSSLAVIVVIVLA
jgi:hypothetical protein